MASGLGRGGRGQQLLEALERLKKKPGDDEEEKRSSEAASKPAPVGRGRAALFEGLKKLHELSLKSSSATSSPPSTIPEQHAPSLVQLRGRGAPPASMLQPAVPMGRTGRGFPFKAPSAQASSFSEAPSSVSLEVATSKAPREAVIQRGEQGMQVQVVANYIRLQRLKDFGVFEYSVTFNPQIDGKSIRIKLVRAQEEIIGKIRSYNGTVLYLPIKISVPALTTPHPIDGTDVTIYIKCVGKKEDHECAPFYNNLFKRIMRELKMTPVGRNYYDSHGGIPVPNHNLEIWPGYVTAVAEQEGGLMLTCDVSHKILRNITVMQILQDIYKKNPHDIKKEAEKAIVGNIVMTRYNNKTYRADEIQWDSNPTSTFQDHTGKDVTFVEYYKKAYDIEINDLRQPLILHRQKPPRGVPESETRLLSLIPELSFMTGLTDDMTSDYHVMKDVAVHTRLTPQQRKISYDKYLHNIQSNPSAKKILADWGLSLDTNLIRLTARVAEPEKIFFGNNRAVTVNDRCDWGYAATNDKIYNPVDINSWSVIYWFKNGPKVMDFIQMMTRVCPQMGINIRRPRTIELKDDRTDSYLKAIQEQATQAAERCQIVVTICPTSRDDRYAAIKKKCYVELAIPSQVINLRTIGMANKLKSVTQKVALQMDCKLGAELWALEIPLKTVMVIGMDVYHDTSQRGRSVVGFVASITPSLTRCFCKTIFQSTHQELVDGLKSCMVAALKKWHEVNHVLPTRIFLYRDGVSDGQLAFVSEYEVEQVADSFKTFGDSYQPKLTVIIVQKRINTRIMECSRDQLCNARPGLILDHTVTRFSWYDFFLVSQHVNQGTVTPTHYIVIRDDCKLRTDNLQRLTYKLTHLYYNWPGTVRVPAFCQYAHKLAQMTGQHLHRNANDIMNDRLFFL